MAKTVEIPLKMSPVVYWSAEFDNSPRHCWPNREGVLMTEGFSKRCNKSHDPRLAGKVEWLRFIHLVNEFLREFRTLPDIDIDMSTEGGFGDPKQLGSGMHDSEGRHWPGFEIYPDWIVFLDNSMGEAKIELHNEDLIWVADKAYDKIQAQYER